MRDYEALTAEWYDLLETLRCGETDLDGFKRLIFDTYHFFENRPQRERCTPQQTGNVQVHHPGLPFDVP